MAIAAFDLKKLDKTTTLELTVNITKEFRFRFWLAAIAIKFAAFILGCKSNIKAVETK